ncbi:MAG: hypothetical protein JW810_04995 [Sedimentisphaerales bacterium]|nr:hypothetical protein [Sedimentisphaerales bacterium]
MAEEFVSELIQPVAGSFDRRAMSRAEPGLPGRFRWRGQEYTVIEVLRAWKQSGPDRDGSGQMYLRKHWYEVRTDRGLIMKIYFERQGRSPGAARKRWWLYAISRQED